MATGADDPHALARLLRRRLEEGPLELPVAGRSMVGVIESGSTVWVQAAPRPRRGEVWAFVDDEGRLTVHRLREVDATSVTGRGSGNPADDAPVDRAQLVGRVSQASDPVGRTRRFGHVDRGRAAAAFRLRRTLRPLRRRWRRRGSTS